MTLDLATLTIILILAGTALTLLPAVLHAVGTWLDGRRAPRRAKNEKDDSRYRLGDNHPVVGLQRPWRYM